MHLHRVETFGNEVGDGRKQLLVRAGIAERARVGADARIKTFGRVHIDARGVEFGLKHMIEQFAGGADRGVGESQIESNP